MTEVMFADTSAFIAQMVEADQHHAEANRFWSRQSPKPHLLTTNLVVAETYTLIRQWAGYKPGFAFLSYIQETAAAGRLSVIWPAQETAENVVHVVAQ